MTQHPGGSGGGSHGSAGGSQGGGHAGSQGGGQGGASDGYAGSPSQAGLQPKDASHSVPANLNPPQVQPLIAPTGNVAADALSGLVNNAVAPWQDLPNQTPIQQVATVVNGVLSVLNMDVAVEAFNLGVGALSSVVPWPALPAAVLGMPHIGTPHTHTHPPSLIPPAPPVPLPSIGTLAIGGCVSVLIGGIPAARCGDLGLALTCGTLAPPFEIAMGSSSVFIGGARAGRMGDMTKHCMPASPKAPPAPGFNMVAAGFGVAMAGLNAAANPAAAAMIAAQTAVDTVKMAVAALMGKDPGVPPCLGAVMMGVPNVLIGGFPMPPLENLARAFFQKLLKPLANALHGIVGKSMGKGRAANFFHELICHTTGHPVDVSNGRLLTSGKDLQLPGPMPLVFERKYATSWSFRDGVLGWGWSHSFDQAVWVETGIDDTQPDGQDHNKIVYRAEDGREIEFPSSAERPAWLQAQPNDRSERWDRFNRLTVRRLAKAHWEITSADGMVREFRAIPAGEAADTAGPRRELARLTLIRDRAGNTIVLRYGREGQLETIIDSAGREIRLESDATSGRLRRILVPHPAGGGWIEHARYGYSESGDLIEVFDALGRAHRMEYRAHVMVRETNRNGLSFYFEYEGAGADSRCVKTWGDGDIYFRKIAYDVPNHVTIVTDSYGHDTRYEMNADNAVVAVTDALGAVVKYSFDDSYHKVAETDALGAETRWEFDARGNCTKVTGADGAEVRLEYNDRNQPVFAVDPVEGEWHWGYDDRGLLIARVDPLQRRVRFVWQVDPNAESARVASERGGRRSNGDPDGQLPKRLVAVVDPANQSTHLGYDAAGNVITLRSPNGAESRWKFDTLGRCVSAVDAKGNAQVRQHDAVGRVVHVQEPDGNVRTLEFDAEGNVLHAVDKQHDVKFAYQGMGRLRARTEAGTTVEFEYDREERLIGIKNEHGHVYRFELGPTGQVVKESGFDGVTREYRRDAAGRVTKVLRPAERETAYEYDAGGRVTAAAHSDGTSEAYAYRADGALLQAKNDEGLVTFERDPLGRVLKEIVGEDWVASEYDVLGMRVGVSSSKGLRQSIERNNMGDVLAVRASVMTKESVPAPFDRDADVASVAPRGSGGVGRGGSDVGVWEARFERDTVGLELERKLPGGVRARWERDQLGRPKKHLIWSGDVAKGAWRYSWDVGDRLRKIVDLFAGPTQYQHDALGNLAAANYADDTIELRMPDAVGNLFRTEDRSDRTYGAAGQLLEARDKDGSVTRYDYDAEGNLVRKQQWSAANTSLLPVLPTRMDGDSSVGAGAGERAPFASPSSGATVSASAGSAESAERTTVPPPDVVWTYEWNGAGMLRKVVRPDGDTVAFGYDALGRRLWKRFRARITRWIWDGNLPLHEWIERATTTAADPTAPPTDATTSDEIAARRRRAELNERPAQGPPSEASHPWIDTPTEDAGAALSPGTPARASGPASASASAGTSDDLLDPQFGTQEVPVTWLFNPETFAPLAKLVGASRSSIITDHLGTPKAMFDEAGTEVWSASIDTYGNLRNQKGDPQACPFRWPGQYEDPETGLYYNRFRYYDSQSGQYVRRDPIGLFGGLAAYAYVADPSIKFDPRGLSCVADLPAEHQSEFADGASFFVPQSKWDALKARLTQMGYEDGLFVTPRSEADRLVASDDLAQLKQRLGISPDQWNEPLVRLDVANPMDFNPRLPTGNETGANENFVPGGRTSGGAMEMVIDPVPMSQLKESGPFFPNGPFASQPAP